MNPEKKQIWIEALRSHKYPQAHGSFLDAFSASRPAQHCCLAVLAHEAADRDVPGLRWDARNAPEIVCRWDAETYTWVQPDSPEEATRWMTELEEMDRGTASERETDGWAWMLISEVTDGDLPRVVAAWAELGEETNPRIGRLRAIEWNDDMEATFGQIADEVAEHL